MVINCPKCKEPTEFRISDAQDSEGEVFKCLYCGYKFRYAER